MKWYEELKDALDKEDGAVMQLATLDLPNTPRVRSLIHRAFLTASAIPTLPLLLSTTDIRTPKITQMNTTTLELVFWTPHTQAQFRILGRASVVSAPEHTGPYPALPDGPVYAALADEGFDWESKRVAMFDAMSGRLKASWCWPTPGTPIEEDDAETWPTTLPKLGEARNEKEERLLQLALSNFALVVVEPVEVDWLALGVVPYRRTRFERRGVDFEAISVAP